MLPLFRLLAALKGLRGTRFDIFGWTAERRMERRLIRDYEAVLDEILASLDSRNLDRAIELASLASGIRGFGPIKAASVERYEKALPASVERFRASAEEAERDRVSRASAA